MENASQSVLWSSIQKFATQGVQLLISLVLARLILPAEYGLIAMLTIFIGIAQAFVDCGFNNALIQKQNRTEIDYSTVFYFNIAVASFLYFILFAFSGLIAQFYEEPLLEPLTKWVSLSIIISSLSVVQRAKLSIEHNFKIQAIVSLISVAIGGFIGIIMAYRGMGVWALVAQTLSSQALTTGLFFVFSKWRPILVFSWSSFKVLFKFGYKILLSGLISVVYNNIYSLVIGKFYCPEQLGYYSKANSLTQMPTSSIAFSLQNALYPYLCEAQNDDKRLLDLFMKYLRLVMYIILPLCGCVFVLAKPFVLSILTTKWAPAITYIQILIIAYLFYPLCYINCQTLNVKGRSDLFLKTDIIVKIASLVILAASVPFGVKVMCYSMVFFYLFNYIVVVINLKKVIQTSLVSQFKAILPILAITLLSSVCAYLVISFFKSDIIQLIVGGISFILIYYLLSKIAKIKELTFLVDYLKRIRN